MTQVCRGGSLQPPKFITVNQFLEANMDSIQILIFNMCSMASWAVPHAPASSPWCFILALVLHPRPGAAQKAAHGGGVMGILQLCGATRSLAPPCSRL